MHRKAPFPAGKIVSSELYRRLRVGIALDAAVHAGVQLHDLARHAAVHCRREAARDDLDGRSGTLAEVAAEIAAPILERRRLAPAHAAGGVDHLDQHVAADRLG
jgi:hypothetical protein